MNTIFKVRINQDGSINLLKQIVAINSDDTNWRPAVEIEPEPTVTSLERVIPQYDLTTDPIGITYVVINMTLAERQQHEIQKIKQKLISSVTTMVHSNFEVDPSAFDTDVLTQSKLEVDSKIAAITAATTHEELTEIVR
jgi:hypothetical protein